MRAAALRGRAASLAGEVCRGYTDSMLRRNPAVAFAVGVVLLAIGFLVPGTTRELILRVAGVLAILAGAAMWAVARRSG